MEGIEIVEGSADLVAGELGTVKNEEAYEHPRGFVEVSADRIP